MCLFVIGRNTMSTNVLCLCLCFALCVFACCYRDWRDDGPYIYLFCLSFFVFLGAMGFYLGRIVSVTLCPSFFCLLFRVWRAGICYWRNRQQMTVVCHCFCRFCLSLSLFDCRVWRNGSQRCRQNYSVSVSLCLCPSLFVAVTLGAKGFIGAMSTRRRAMRAPHRNTHIRTHAHPHTHTHTHINTHSLHLFHHLFLLYCEWASAMFIRLEKHRERIQRRRRKKNAICPRHGEDKHL